MEMRNLGRTGLKVAALCLGGNVFGWSSDEAASREALDAYMAGGGNFIDTADIYSRWVEGHSGGESEAILGRWMQERGNRHQIVLATKAGGAMGEGPNDKGLSRAHLVAAVEDSLRRLRTDYIDLYQAHFDDPATPLDETLRAFDDLVRQGKVRYIGASNYSCAGYLSHPAPIRRPLEHGGRRDASRRGWARPGSAPRRAVVAVLS